MAEHQYVRRRRSQEVAIMSAIAVIPRTFQRSLLPRSTVDQGVITGLTAVLVYMMGLLTQDTIDTAASLVVSEEAENGPASRTVAVWVSAAAVGVGLVAQYFNKYTPTEKLPRSATRTAGKWVQNAGIAGLIMGAIEGVNHFMTSGEKSDDEDEPDLLPYFILGGLLYTTVGEYLRAKGDGEFSLRDNVLAAKPGRAVGIGLGITALLSVLVYGERFVAGKVDEVVAKNAPRLKPHWLPIGHVFGLATVGSVIYGLMHRTYGKMEHSAGILEAGFTTQPTSPLQSGSPSSLVSWESLSIQGRRHVGTTLTAKELRATMAESCVEPIRIFVGLDTALTEAERVQIALDELERTGAYERACILVVSPTGTGYVNYVMSEAVEYLSRGNVASVTIQYSKRPSPMSLDRVDEGHIQYRMLLNGINKRLRKIPVKKRPRILLFGESLGAWTSQDSMMHEGTDGLQALNIDRALWIGTPKGSKWSEQVLSDQRLNTDRELVGHFDNYEQVLALSKSDREKLRYIMVTHFNDPIAQFGLELLIKQPEWVADETKRPIGMGSTTRYRTPALFIQTLIDMKNALQPIPGKFVANAHDYRADLARFVAFSFGFTASAKQLAAIEKALRLNEVAREKRIQGEV